MRSGFGQRDAGLALVLAAAVLVRGLAGLVRLEEQHLGDAFVGVDLGRQWRGVRELEGYVPFPLGLEWCHISESAEELQHRVQAIEHQIYPDAAGLVGSGKVAFSNGQTLIDGEVAGEPVLRTFE